MPAVGAVGSYEEKRNAENCFCLRSAGGKNSPPFPIERMHNAHRQSSVLPVCMYLCRIVKNSQSSSHSRHPETFIHSETGVSLSPRH